MKITENGIGSNYRTLNNEPVSHFHDPRIKVEMYPSAWGKVAVSIICDDLGFNSGVREFNTEAEAKLFAINTSEKLASELDNKLLEAVVKRVLNHSGK